MCDFSQHGAGPHSHIHTLKHGYVYGEQTAKQMDLAKKLANAGCGLIIQLVGSKHTGKSAFVEAFALQNTFPSIYTTSLIFNSKPCRFERLIRRACRINFTEQAKVVQGEVASLSSNRMTLKTVDMESSFDFGPRMRAEIERRRIAVGDVIKVFRESGIIFKIGISPSQSIPEYGIYNSVALPEGECCQVLANTTEMSLEELDVLNTNGDLQERLIGCVDTTREVREEINRKVGEWQANGNAVIDCGVIIIVDGDAIGEKELKEIKNSLKTKFKPLILILCEEVNQIIKKDAVVMKLEERDEEINRKIINNRAEYFGVELPEDITNYYLELANKNGMRYTLGIMQAAASANAQNLEQLKHVSALFKEPNSLKQD